jgi:N6-adenosine-specific RNA methylase IME4
MGVRVRVEQMALHARQAKDRDLIADAMELQLTAERRLGEMLIVARETGQMSQGGRPRKGETPADREGVLDKATLAEAGVTYKLSVKAQKLAAFDEERFADVLQAARDKIRSGGAVVVNPIKDLTTADKKVLRAVKEAQLAANQKALPDKKFGVILADPEWDFKTWSEAGKDRSAENHYPVSSDAVIAARPVGELAARDCVLWLWTPCNRIHRALAVMAAWGFEYKSLVVWDKFSFGTGFWFRDRAEILLVGTRGNVPAPAMGEQWENLVSSPKSLIHSDKPVWAYELIEHYFPNLPKIELNARRGGMDGTPGGSKPRKMREGLRGVCLRHQMAAAAAQNAVLHRPELRHRQGGRGRAATAGGGMSTGFTDRSGLEPATRVARTAPIEAVFTRLKSTDKAIMVKDSTGATAWLPRKHLGQIEEGLFGEIRLTLPTWLAIEKGLRTAPVAGQQSLF